MTDIQLYQHCEKYIHEIHKFDGMCFVEPYDYQEFVQGLDIQDSVSDRMHAVQARSHEGKVPDEELLRR